MRGSNSHKMMSKGDQSKKSKKKMEAEQNPDVRKKI